jgi:phospholipase C
VTLAALVMLLAAVPVPALATANTVQQSVDAAGRDGVPAFSHIVVVVLENKEFDRVSGSSSAPFLNQLANEYGLATRYYGVSHPSLPNYLAMIGGNTFGVQDDCTRCFQAAPNLVDQLEASGITWRGYFESMPRPCYVGDSPDGLYAQKHNPFIYFDSIRNDLARCGNIVPLDWLATDVAAGALPSLIWIGPNLRSSTHDGTIAEGDRWLATHLPALLHSPAFEPNGLLVVTYDEGDSDAACCGGRSGGGRIVTVVASPLSRRGYSSSTPFNHYSLLRTIEDSWGLDHLGHAGDPSVSNFAEFFGSGE